MGEYGAYTDRSRRAATTWAASAQPVHRDDDPQPQREGVVTDGPFAETKEQLGGYYLIEAKISTRPSRSRRGSRRSRPGASRSGRSVFNQ
jgi:hypothetical protein